VLSNFPIAVSTYWIMAGMEAVDDLTPYKTSHVLPATRQ
jgi:hypothetical protein